MQICNVMVRDRRWGVKMQIACAASSLLCSQKDTVPEVPARLLV